MLPDKEWSEMLSKDMASVDGPVVTGDPVIDRWEAELFHRTRGMSDG